MGGEQLNHDPEKIPGELQLPIIDLDDSSRQSQDMVMLTEAMVLRGAAASGSVESGSSDGDGVR